MDFFIFIGVIRTQRSLENVKLLLSKELYDDIEVSEIIENDRNYTILSGKAFEMKIFRENTENISISGNSRYALDELKLVLKRISMELFNNDVINTIEVYDKNKKILEII